MKKKKYTHTGVLKGFDARTHEDFRRMVYIRETKKYWITQHGSKYKKEGCFLGVGVGEWPLYYLDMKTIFVLPEEVKM